MSLQGERVSGSLPLRGRPAQRLVVWRIALYRQNLGKIRSAAHSPLISQACFNEKRD